MKKNFLILLTLFFSNAIFAQDAEIKTVPEKAEVWVKKSPSDAGKKLGETPYKGKVADLYSLSDGTGTAFIEVKLDGFVSKEFILLGQAKESDFELSVNLTPRPEIETIKKHDLLIAEILKAQKLIRSRNYTEALTKLTDLEKTNSHFSIISELKGIAYYMSKDMEKSLSMFRMAFSQNPDNVDAYKMKVYLEKKLNIDAEGN